VFDIRDPHNPREIAYFNAPVTPRIVPPAGVVPSPSNWAMSSPAFAPQRSEIWYSDGLAGFFAVRLTNHVAPFGSGVRNCLPRRARIGRRGIAGIRLWQTRRRLLRMRVKPLRRTRRSFRYCVRGSRARVSAVFRHDGRVELITTTARGHGRGRVRPGAPARVVRRAYPRRRSMGRGVVRAGHRSPHVIGIRRGRVRFVAVANRILRGNPRKLRRHLRIAGL
jgi:hypothetical protein